MHSVNTDHDLKQEQLNKSSILSSKSFLETLLNMWTTHVVGNIDTLLSNLNGNLIVICLFTEPWQWCLGLVRNVGLYDLCAVCAL